ncbi:MAG: beta-propeller fold lactonase family protein [Acidobacteriota bacterium]
MKGQLSLVILISLLIAGCGGGSISGNDPASCFKPQPGEVYLDRDAIFVANTGSSSISAFQLVGPSTGPAAGPVCGSPFAVADPPTALAGGILFDQGLLVLSQPAKSISMYSVDYLTSELTGPDFTVTTSLTPVAIAATGHYFYVANAEGNVSAYSVSSDGGSATELQGSPFLAGAGPDAITATAQPSVLYVANAQSNNISGYSLDASTGIPTPLPGSPYPAGQGPASIKVLPEAMPNSSGVRLVVVANKLSNNVSVYSMASDGSLSPVPGSPFPAGSAPTGTSGSGVSPLTFTYVSNSESNNISGYSIDNATGTLTLLPGSPFPAGTSPSSIAAASGGFWVYVANAGSDTLSVYQIGQDGALTQVSGSPFAVGKSPSAVLYFQVPQ